MRQIVLDTETTGLKYEDGHRVIEIGCVELVERQLTGRHFHYYFNPEREVDAGALKVHGLDQNFLLDKPLFKDLAHQLIEFISGAELIIHNAPFDVGFLEYEFGMLELKLTKIADYCRVIDTLVLARKMHPGQKNSLDALCKRYEIDNSHRELHGALLDAEILARVYLAMTGGQTSLFSNQNERSTTTQMLEKEFGIDLSQADVHVLAATAEEEVAHQQYVELLAKKSGKNYWE